MVMASDSERTVTLIKSIKDAGLSYESMSRFQREAFTMAIPGLKSEADLAKLLSGNLNEVAASMEEKKKQDVYIKKFNNGYRKKKIMK